MASDLQEQDCYSYEYYSFSDSCPSDDAEPIPTRKPNPRFANASRSRERANQILELKQRLIRGESMRGVPEADLVAVLSNLTDERDRLTAEKRFRRAERMDDAIQKAEKAIDDVHRAAARKLALKEIRIQKEQVSERTAKYDEETDKLEQDLISQFESQRVQLEQQHANELDAFQERWMSERKGRLYNRSSNTLISLRRQLNAMVAQRRYRDADEVQAQIEQRQKLEEQMNHETMQRDFDEALRKLQTRQANETKHLEESIKIKLKTFKDRRERLRVRFQNRGKYVEACETNIKGGQKRTISVVSTSSRSTCKSGMKVVKSEPIEEEVANLQLPPLAMPKTRAKKPKK